MKTEEVTCDGCGADLTTRTNSVDYRLVLASESKPGRGAGFYTDMMKYPPVKRTHHFCTLSCLDHWRDRERHCNDLWRAWMDKWKEEHGTKREDGRIQSYPGVPEETRKACVAEFEAAALEAFPMSRPPR